MQPYGYRGSEENTSLTALPDEAPIVPQAFTDAVERNRQQAEKRAAIYARCATTQETGASFAPVAQIAACEQFSAEQGYALVDGQIYEEIGSGTTINRPGLTALLAAAKQGAFDAVFVFDFNRLSRKPAQLAFIVATLNNYGVAVTSVQEPHGTSDLDRELQHLHAELLAAVDLLEREARSKRRSQRHKEH